MDGRDAKGHPHLVPLERTRLRDGDSTESTETKSPRKKFQVSLTIDDNNFPHKVLLIRGTAHLDTVEGIVPEYVAAAERYFGREQGQAWIKHLRGLIPGMVRITVTPEWVGLLDFQTRFPSALSA